MILWKIENGIHITNFNLLKRKNIYIYVNFEIIQKKKSLFNIFSQFFLMIDFDKNLNVGSYSLKCEFRI